MGSPVFSKEFEPILLPRETAHVYTESDEYDVECVAVGALPRMQVDFGALTAATWDTGNTSTNLEFPTTEMAQLRMQVLDVMNLRFNNLAATKQWRALRTDFTLPQFPEEQSPYQDYLWKASEFFIWEDDAPSFDFYSDVTLATSRVLFSGWRFRVRKIQVRGKIDLWVSGWPSGKS